MERNEMIFGIRAVIEAVEAGKDIDKILIKKDLQSDLAQELFAAVRGRNIVVQKVPIEKINRMSRDEGLSNTEIAENLQLSKKTVENHLNLALKELRNAVLTFLLVMMC